MITTIESLREKLEKFNSLNKYLVTCEYCHNQLLYTENEKLIGKSGLGKAIKH